MILLFVCMLAEYVHSSLIIFKRFKQLEFLFFPQIYIQLIQCIYLPIINSFHSIWLAALSIVLGTYYAPRSFSVLNQDQFRICWLLWARYAVYLGVLSDQHGHLNLLLVGFRRLSWVVARIAKCLELRSLPRILSIRTWVSQIFS